MNEESKGRGMRALERLADWLCSSPKLVLGVVLALTLVAATQAVRLEVTTSRTNLGHATSESEREFGEFLHNFGTPNDVIAVIEQPQGAVTGPGADEELRRVADELATALGTDEAHVRSTFHKVDLDYFLRHILLFVPPDEFGQIRSVLESDFVGKIRSGQTGGLDAMLRQFDAAFSSRAGGEIDATRATAGLDALSLIAREVKARLEDPERRGLAGFRDLIPPLKAGAIDDAGYLQSRDGGMRVVFVRPAVRSDENDVVLPMVKAIRATCASVAERHPGVRIRVTGLPALQADETVLVDRDMVVSTIASIVVIAVVLLYGYRRPRQTMLSLLSLGAGVVWTLAWIRLQFGHVNLVASVFAPILLGRGSDFDVYLIARYNIARAAGASKAEAVKKSLAASGGMVSGGIITSIAFFVAATGQFGVFQQLGLVVGAGLLIVLLASLIITPTLLYLIGDSTLPIEHKIEAQLERIPSFGAGPGAVALRRPGTVVGAAAAVLVLLGFAIRNLSFDYNLINLLPAETEAVSAQVDLGHRSDYGSDVAVVTVDSVEEARRVTALLAAKPNVGRVESIASFLPASQESKLPLIESMRGIVTSIPPLTRPTPPTTATAFGSALTEMLDTVDDKVMLAEQADHPVAPALRRFAAAVKDLNDTFHRLSPDEAQRGVDVMETRLFALLASARDILQANYKDLKPLTREDLPRATRERFFGADGRTAVYVFPRVPGNGPELDAFAADVRSVAPNATGFPIIYFDSSRTIFRGLLRSSALALVVVVIAVLLHFRNLRATALTIVPLVVATVAMPALMHIFGIPHNMANIVALPLLVGLGTDYGLQLVHHVRMFPNDSLRRALAETGLGVFVAGGTTAAGFGALAVSRHVGGRSLGIELFLGTAASMVGALVILPAVLELAARRRARRSLPQVPPRSASGG